MSAISSPILININNLRAESEKAYHALDEYLISHPECERTNHEFREIEKLISRKNEASSRFCGAIESLFNLNQ